MAYGSGGHLELGVGEIEGTGCNVYAEKCCSVSKCEFDGGVHGYHVRGHPSGIRAGLNDESLECDALKENRRNSIHTQLRI